MRNFIGTVCLFLTITAAVTAVKAGEYSQEVITNLRATCGQRKDIPADKEKPYCDCFIDLVQKNVSSQDFLKLDSAVRTRS
jgi:hypothetical protein